jgi:hypothetical protein
MKLKVFTSFFFFFCEGLSLTASLNKYFLGYLATLVLDLVYLEQICFLTIFVHGLAEDESHR